MEGTKITSQEDGPHNRNSITMKCTAGILLITAVLSGGRVYQSFPEVSSKVDAIFRVLIGVENTDKS